LGTLTKKLAQKVKGLVAGTRQLPAFWLIVSHGTKEIFREKILLH
jgi:hypothetical protein